MNRFLIVLVTLFVSFNIAIAQQAEEVQTMSSKDQKIEELMEILGSEEQYQAYINVGLDNLIKKYGSQITESNAKILREESIEMVKRFLDTDMKRIYSKYLTEKEIVDLIAFYNSETGHRFRQIQPLITQEINQVMVNKYMEEFKVNLAEKLKQ